MGTIYEIIQQNPEYFAWIFGIVNVLWIGFTYFNKQSHERSLKVIEQDLRYSADRRLKIFELKATEYGAYAAKLDEFGKKSQNAFKDKMQPIFDQYLNDMMVAGEQQNKEMERDTVVWFSNQISGLMQEGLEDVIKLKSETNRIKMIATDEMIKTFEELEVLTQESMDTANEFVGKFLEIIINKQEEQSQMYQDKLVEIGVSIQSKSKKLLQQMRSEIGAV
ncbi:hypothetical protein [Psychromonas sp. Urea-02u-13]|uniref:hypothetical protein n=1 Tax=Psychromonas sp. Urea-02u-13 TaxID=2058326 RepID=UPI000C329757|nr:hypothetical protein [Psychromonas sp. Urea-02u-13]PKG36977.1 hypothetical protein CXF74_21330 [Psychromonas sp. Urea-02u-13]